MDAEYATLLHALASFGFAIVAPRACNLGCLDLPWQSRPDDPPLFAIYYEQLELVLAWAQSQAAAGVTPFTELDFSHGVGVGGHSMGGQAALYAASNAAKNNITAAVFFHAFSHSFPSLPPNVPILAFTGDSDFIAPPWMAHQIFDHAANSTVNRGLVNKKNCTHFEPSTAYIDDFNPLLAQFTAAWFHVFLSKSPRAFGLDFDSMIFGSDHTSLCGGGNGEMVNCTLVRL